MNTTIEVICYKYKPLKNNEFPIKLRITQNRKRRYVNLGVSTKLEDWDFAKNRPKPNCPDREYIEQIISDKQTEYRSKVLELKSIGKEFTPTSLISKVAKPTKPITVGELFLSTITDLKAQKRTGYALSHLEVYNSLIKFNGHLSIYFSDIDITWLKRYENWLRSNGSAENTIGKRFRTLRAVFNVAIERSIVKVEYYPFKAYKVSKLQKTTAKRSISKDEIAKVLSYETEHEYTRLALDLFAFSYLMAGINFVDMAHLRGANLVDKRLIYTRQKTGKLIRLPLQPKALEIIERHISPFYDDKDYIFPILSSFHKTEMQQRNRIHKVIVTSPDQNNGRMQETQLLSFQKRETEFLLNT